MWASLAASCKMETFVCEGKRVERTERGKTLLQWPQTGKEKDWSKVKHEINACGCLASVIL